jgi:isopropylmalate/homocitrate/citramalate synthase
MKLSQNEKWFTEKYWLSPYNWLDEVRRDFDLPKKVRIHEVTLREDDQSPYVSLRHEEKIRIAEALNELGVWSIEIAPTISKEDEIATKEMAKRGFNAKVISFVSWRKEDVDLARKCDVDGVIIDFVGNPWQGKTFFNMSPDEQIQRGVETLQYAKQHGLYAIALPWDNYRAPLDFLEKLYKRAVNDGKADEASISDTFGCALPWTTVHMIKKVRSWIPGVPIQKHVHNDFGLATAETVAAVCGGAEVLHTTMCGLGERAGNAATEEAAVALELLLGVKTGINLEKLHYTAELIQDLTKIRMAPNKPIVGSNIFRTGSGWIFWMQQKAQAAGRATGLLPFTPDLVGTPVRSRYIIGKAAGNSLVQTKLKEMGISVTDQQLTAITEKIKEESMIRKGEVPETEVKRIVEQVKQKIP